MRLSQLDIKATLEYVAPREPAENLAEWNTDLDWPGVRATVRVPHRVLCALRSVPHMMWGETPGYSWGIDRPGDATSRARDETFRAATLAEAEQAALEWVAEGAEIVRAFYRARQARLDLRAATLTDACADHGAVVRDGQPVPVVV